MVETESESQEKQAEHGIWQWRGVTDEFGHVSLQKEQRNQVGVRKRNRNRKVVLLVSEDNRLDTVQSIRKEEVKKERLM